MRTYTVFLHEDKWIIEERVFDKIIFAWQVDSAADVLSTLAVILPQIEEPLRLTNGDLCLTCHRWLKGEGPWWMIFAGGKVWGVQAPTERGAVARLKSGTQVDAIYIAAAVR